MPLELTKSQTAHIAQFRGYNFRMLQATEPTVMEHGNVVFPRDWSDDDCAIWRRDYNCPGKGWVPGVGLMQSFRSSRPFRRLFARG